MRLEEITRLRDLGVRLNAQGLGAEANATWASMVRLQREYNPKPAVRYLYGGNWTAGLGHIALLDFFVKRKQLGLCDARHVIVKGPHPVANPFYLSLWAPHFEFTDEWPENMIAFEDLPMVLEVGNEILPLEDAVLKINTLWQGGPLVAMPQDKIDEGWQRLRELGVKGWFVALHIRQGGTPTIRNVEDAKPYQAAVNRINETGGSVVRFGARQSNDLNGLIDHFDVGGWFDIFLISQCRFLIAANSGPSVVGCTFGKDVLIPNFAPRGSLYPYPAAKLLQKHVFDIDGGEVPGEQTRFYWTTEQIAEKGWRSVDSSPGEILAAVESMI